MDHSTSTSIVGNIDIISRDVIEGWVVNKQREQPVFLHMYVDGVLFTQFTADRSRPDVERVGYGREQCGFRITLSDQLRDSKLVEIVDIRSEITIWRIDLETMTILNNLMAGELPAASVSSNTEIIDVQQKPDSVIIDVSDLVYYIGHHDNLTGIQRVQSSVIQAIVKYKLLHAERIQFVVFNGNTAQFNVIDRRSFLALLNDLSLPKGERTVKFDEMAARVGDLFNRGPLVPRGNDETVVFLLLGAAWVIPDYTKQVLQLKATMNARFVATFHDLIPIFARETCDQGTAEVFQVYIDQIVRHVDMALCVSSNTAQDLTRYCMDAGIQTPPTVVTRNGSSLEEFFPSSTSQNSEMSQELGSTPYVLFVSTIEGRKNHHYVFEIWKRLVLDGVDVPRIICVGRIGWRSENFLQDMIRTDYLDGKFDIRENVSDAALTELYKNCLFTIYPSKYEGWGLPVGESLSYGKLCVLTEASSLPEVAGDLGVYIPLDDVATASQSIRNLLNTPGAIERANNAIRDRYVPIRWADVAASVVDGCMRALNSPPIPTLPEWRVGREYPFRHLRADGSTQMGGQMYDAILRAHQRVILDGFYSQSDKLLGLEGRAGNWCTPEEWGCWSVGTSAEVHHSIQIGALESTKHIGVYVSCRVTEPYTSLNIQLRIGASPVVASYRLSPGRLVLGWPVKLDVIRRYGRLVEQDKFVICLKFQILGVTQDLREAVKHIDSRDIGIGFESIALLGDSDPERLDVIERVLFSRGNA